MLPLNKTLKTGLLIAGIVVLTAGTIYGSMRLGNHLDKKPTSTADFSQSCAPGPRTDHKAIIQNDTVIPGNTVAPLCDTLTITNLDDKARIIAFGAHDDHVPYDGITEKTLAKGQSFTVTLVQAGNFRFHDHIHDEVQGTFAVGAQTDE